MLLVYKQTPGPVQAPVNPTRPRRGRQHPGLILLLSSSTLTLFFLIPLFSSVVARSHLEQSLFANTLWNYLTERLDVRPEQSCRTGFVCFLEWAHSLVTVSTPTLNLSAWNLSDTFSHWELISTPNAFIETQSISLYILITLALLYWSAHLPRLL